MIKANLSRSSKQKINLVLSNKYWYEVMKAIEREDIKRALKIMALVKDTSNVIEQEKITFVSRYIEYYQLTSHKYFLTRAAEIVERIIFYDSSKLNH